MFCFFQFFFFARLWPLISPYTKRDTNWIRSTHKAIFIQYPLFSSCIATIYALFFGGIFYTKKNGSKHDMNTVTQQTYYLCSKKSLIRVSINERCQRYRRTASIHFTAGKPHLFQNIATPWYYDTFEQFFYCRSENLYQYKITIK